MKSNLSYLLEMHGHIVRARISAICGDDDMAQDYWDFAQAVMCNQYIDVAQGLAHPIDRTAFFTIYPEFRNIEEQWVYAAENSTSDDIDLTLEDEWDNLSDEQRYEIYDDFQQSCTCGSSEPSAYWYPLLMPMVMNGYVGD